jgi:hypothetical protein
MSFFMATCMTTEKIVILHFIFQTVDLITGERDRLCANNISCEAGT